MSICYSFWHSWLCTILVFDSSTSCHSLMFETSKLWFVLNAMQYFTGSSCKPWGEIVFEKFAGICNVLERHQFQGNGVCLGIFCFLQLWLCPISLNLQMIINLINNFFLKKNMLDLSSPTTKRDIFRKMEFFLINTLKHGTIKNALQWKNKYMWSFVCMMIHGTY